MKRKLKNELLLIIAVSFLSIFILLEFSFYKIYSGQIISEINHKLETAAFISARMIETTLYTNDKILSPKDKEYSAELKRLKFITEQSGVTNIYLMKYVDGNFIFVMDSEDDPEESILGDIYEEPPQELIDSVSSREPVLMKDFYTDEFGTFKSSFTPVGNPTDNLFAGCDYDSEVIKTTLNKFLVIVAISAVIIIIFTLILGVVLSKYIFNPLANVAENMAKHAKDFDKGCANLTVKIVEVGNNEISEIAKSFNKLQNSICKNYQSIIKGNRESLEISTDLDTATNKAYSESHNIKKFSEEVKQHTESLDSKVMESSNILQEIISIIEKIVVNIANQSNSVLSASSVIEELVASINSTSTIATEKERLLASLQDKARDGENVLHTTLESIQSTGEITDKVVELIESVNVIAEQINMLSLNAAIEAAHAGEHGKGFVVVAEEIGKLAISTSESAKEIAESIKLMSTEMSKTEVAAERTSVSFGYIIQSVEEVSQGLSSVISSLKEMSTGSGDILSEIMFMRDNTMLVEESSSVMIEKTRDIQGLNTELSEFSTINKEKINSIGARILEIVEAINYVTELGNNNKKIISNFKEQLSNFELENELVGV